MSGALKTKLRSYLKEWETLELRYRQVLESAQDMELESRQNLDDLYEFDQLCYEYHAIKTYYSVSKSKWNSSDRKPLEEFEQLMPKVEAKLSLDELYKQHTGLQVLRKYLKMSAESGGKIAQTLMNTSNDLVGLRLIVDDLRREAHKEVAKDQNDSLREWATIKPSVSRKTPVVEKELISKAVVSSDGAPAQMNRAQTTVPSSIPSLSPSVAPSPVSSSVPSTRAAGAESVTSHSSVSSPYSSGTGRPSNLAGTVEPLGNAGSKPVATVSVTSALKPTAPAAHGDDDSSATRDKAIGESFKRPVGLEANTNMEVPENAHSKSMVLVEPNSHHSLEGSLKRRDTSADTEVPGSSIRKKHKVVFDHSDSLQSSQSPQPKSFNSENTVNAQSLQNVSTKLQHDPINATLCHQKVPSPASSNGVSTQANNNNANGNSKDEVTKSAASQTEQSETHSEPVNKAIPVKKRLKSSFAHFLTWNKDHTRCIINAAAEHPDSPDAAIQTALNDKFKVMIRLDEAKTLRSHYGLCESTMEKYAFYIQSFNSVVNEIKVRKARYVTVPWTEIHTKFFRLTRLHLSDEELKGRYHLFLLHRRVYGSKGEPSSNYHEEVEAFKRRYPYLRKSTLDHNKFSSPNRKDRDLLTQNNAIISSRTPSHSSGFGSGSSGPVASKNNLSHSNDQSRVSTPTKSAQIQFPSSHQIAPQVVVQALNTPVKFRESEDSHASPLSKVPSNKQPLPNLQKKKVLKENAGTSKSSPQVSETSHRSPDAEAQIPHANKNASALATHDESKHPKSAPAVIGAQGSQLHPQANVKSQKGQSHATTNKSKSPNEQALQTSVPDLGKTLPINQSSPTTHVSDSSSLWTPAVLKAMVESYCAIKPEVPSIAQAMIQYIKLKTGVVITLGQLVEKAKTSEFLAELKKVDRSGAKNCDAKLQEFIKSISGTLTLSDRIQFVSDQMKSGEHPDHYYRSRLEKIPLTKQWDFPMHKCIISSIEYAVGCNLRPKDPNSKFVKSQILLFIKFRLLREYSVKVTREVIITRLNRMMECEVFNDASCRFIKNVIENI